MSIINSLKNRALMRQPKQVSTDTPVDMNRVATIVLSGGEGTRLFPLTSTRCKPAISFGGRYRLIDIPLSNSINSGCLKIFIVTQFLSSSLHQHIFKTYHPGSYSTGFIELLPAEQKPKNKNWFQGTADAVRQNIEYFIDTPVDYFLILSGDQLYNMNFQEMMRFAKNSNADLVVATLPVEDKETKRLGILKINEQQQIVDFLEKPETLEAIKDFAIPKNVQDTFSEEDASKRYLGSMGIYLFKREYLFKLLQQDSREDFGKHLIPTAVKQGKTFAYVYDGYWEDIGTIESYYQANMSLTQLNPKLDWYDENNPIFTSHHNLPGPKIYDAKINNSILCEGVVVGAQEVTNSILGMRSIVHEGTIIRNSYVIGNDYYTAPLNPKTQKPYLIGKNCVIEKAIIDKQVYIGNNVKLINQNNLMHYNSDDIYIRDGVIIVTRGATLPDGFIL